jgi:hypothetical protein
MLGWTKMRLLASLAGPFGFPLGFAQGFGKTGQARECAGPHMSVGCAYMDRLDAL